MSGGRAAPFFRYPGLNDSTKLNGYLATRNDAIISCDVVSDDWRRIDANEIVKRTLARLQRERKGIILFHDTESATVEALPILLRELERRGYRIAHMVPKPGPAEPAAPQVAAGAAQHPSPVLAAVRPATGEGPLLCREGWLKEKWCGREESNLHEQAHSDLNAARLPFPPRPHSVIPRSRVKTNKPEASAHRYG